MGYEHRSEIEVEGRRLAWRSVGRGPRLLLLNGYAASSEDWDRGFLTKLGRSFEVICPDNRGIGASELGEGKLTIEGMAADFEVLLDSLGVERTAVAGWSMGDFIAQRLAARSPARITALALLSTDPGGQRAVLAEPAVWAALTDHTGSPRLQAWRLISLLFPPQVAEDIFRRFGDLVAASPRRHLKDGELVLMTFLLLL